TGRVPGVAGAPGAGAAGRVVLSVAGGAAVCDAAGAGCGAGLAVPGEAPFAVSGPPRRSHGRSHPAAASSTTSAAATPHATGRPAPEGCTWAVGGATVGVAVCGACRAVAPAARVAVAAPAAAVRCRVALVR